MREFLILLFIASCFWSVGTTYYAIFRILSNDFNGSKLEWILISMIAYIGPILYLTKGRKLVVKRPEKVLVVKKSEGNKSE